MSHLRLLHFLTKTLLCLPLAAQAFEWETRRFDGRDYVSTGSIATFYELPAPAPVVEPVPGQPPTVVALTSGKRQLSLTLGTRSSVINGVAHWLSFPVQYGDGRAWVSRMDVSRIVEPRFRPELIKGFEPVTTVVLDAGHGGHDKGARSSFGAEKDYSLDVVMRLRKRLENAGYKVVLTRTTDRFIPLHERPAVANRISESIFVSVHFNGAGWNPAASGFEIFSITPRGAPSTDQAQPATSDLREELGNSKELPSAALAGSVFHAMLGRVPVSDRGIKHARFAVLRVCERPGILVEGGFLTNSAEAAAIAKPEWRENLAEAIADGIDQYKLLAERGRAPKNVADYRKK